ncbi:MAG TPA: permease-like cell division protein FtsX [bacterium]|nr:permease-like cell division protein FtsX [bacterium]
MFLTTIYRIFKTSVLSLWRNRWLSLAATLIMVLTLFSITFFAGLLIFINRTSVSLKSKVDIIVYFNDTVSKDQIFNIQNSLYARSDVRDVQYISKEKALERWREQNKDNDRIRDVISEANNPLPRSIEIKSSQPENLESIYGFVSKDDYKPLIKDISYRKNKDLVERLVKITSFVRYLGWVLSSIFVLISILIIYNTIRLTIYARSEEIEIMKLVGASDWYVQGPFFLEGASYGILAAFTSAIVLFLAFNFSLPPAERYLGAAYANSMSEGLSFGLLLVIQLVVGLLLGTICSVFAVKKYLRT